MHGKFTGRGQITHVAKAYRGNFLLFVTVGFPRATEKFYTLSDPSWLPEGT
jgi:hypothetical protein